MADILAQELTDDLKNLIFEKVKMAETGYIAFYSSCRSSKLLGYIKKNLREPSGHYVAVQVSPPAHERTTESIVGKEMTIRNDIMLLETIQMILTGNSYHFTILYTQGTETPKNEYDDCLYMVKDGMKYCYSYSNWNRINDDTDDEDYDPAIQYQQEEQAKMNMYKNVVEKIKNLLG